ncbi:hypothetical protein Tco_1401616 [Tanacetum coccineum]
MFYFDLYDDSSFPCPPPEPPDFEINLIIEIDAPEMNNFDEVNEDECFDPGGDEIYVEDDDSFTFVIWTFLPFLTYPEVSPLLSSTKNEDTIYDPGISTQSLWHLIGMELSCALMRDESDEIDVVDNGDFSFTFVIRTFLPFLTYPEELESFETYGRVSRYCLCGCPIHGTDIAKISRKWSKPDKHGHGNRKENTRAGRMLSKRNPPPWQSYTSPNAPIGGNPQGECHADARKHTKIKIVALKDSQKKHKLFLAQVNQKELKEKLLGDYPVIRDSPEVFPEELPGLPPPRQVEFSIDL